MEKTLNVVFCLKGYLCTWTIYSSIRSDFIALGFSFILFPAFTSCCCHSENPFCHPNRHKASQVCLLNMYSNETTQQGLTPASLPLTEGINSALEFNRSVFWCKEAFRCLHNVPARQDY